MLALLSCGFFASSSCILSVLFLFGNNPTKPQYPLLQRIAQQLEEMWEILQGLPILFPHENGVCMTALGSSLRSGLKEKQFP